MTKDMTKQVENKKVTDLLTGDFKTGNFFLQTLVVPF